MKKIFKCLGLICLSVAVAIGSFFVTKKETKSMIASADTLSTDYSFTGSNMLTVACGWNDYSNSYLTWGLSNISVDFSTGSNGLNVTFKTKSMTGHNFDTFIEKTDNFKIESNKETTRRINYDSYVYFNYHYYCNDYVNFVADIYKIRIRSVEYANDFWTYLTYYDANGNYVEFSVVVANQGTADYAHAKMFMYDDRTYFIGNGSSLSESQQYNQGYQQGLADNQQSIYNNGFSAGKIIGYNNGKSDGIASANNYSFIGLIGAVFDAPLQTFKGLLNFNVLGVNLLDFAMALITIALVVYVVRIIKGGR